VGATSWGATLALLLVRKGLRPCLLVRDEAEAAHLVSERRLRGRLPGLSLPPEVQITASPDCLEQAEIVILCVPSQSMRRNLARILPHLSPRSVIVSAAKGLEMGSGLRMSQVIGEQLGAELAPCVCALSGPNLAHEIVRGLPATSVVACSDLATAEFAQGILMAPGFRVYTHTDLVGVELAGSLKNIVALGAGMSDGLSYGFNAKAAFITRGLAEITRLGLAAGANPLTFAGLAGLGDLLTTCYSPHSRNRYAGQELARGRALDEILSGLGQTVEGISTTIAARELAARLCVEMPITEHTYRVLFEGEPIAAAVEELMARERKQESLGLVTETA